MIYIAYDHNGYPISIVNAKSSDLAKAYWHGANIIPNSSKSLDDFTPLDKHPTGVYPLLKTHIEQLAKYGGNPQERILVYK